jgi:GNAT superfamily N-acetyltransferase
MSTTKTAPLSIRDLTPDDAPACDAIIASLPYFFGDPAGVADCAKAVRSQPGVVALFDGGPVGFITLERHFAESAEITWMAVHADHRRQGIGRALIEAAVERARRASVRTLCVLTLGPSVSEERGPDNYHGTRRFYRANGFVPLRELELRTWNDSHALMLARAIAS